MNKIRHIGLMGCLLCCFISPTMAGPNDAVAIVNGKPIKQSQLDMLIKQMEAGGQKVDENSKKAMLDVLINREVLAQEAEKTNMDKAPEFAVRLEMVRQEMLANYYLREHGKKAPTDEATLRTQYDKLKQRLGNKEYNVRQIVVATEDEAKNIIGQLAKGADFATLAKEKSTDVSTRDKGGSIDWVIPAIMRRPFGNIIAGLPKGLYTTVPVQTSVGWVILKVEDIRDKEPPAFDKVKAQLSQQIQQEQTEKMVMDLRAKANINTNPKPEVPGKK